MYRFGSRLEAPTVANGIEPTLARSSTHYIPATISPRPRRPENSDRLQRVVGRNENINYPSILILNCGVSVKSYNLKMYS